MSKHGLSIGYNLSVPLDQPRSVLTETTQGFTIKTNFRTLYSTWRAVAPALGSAFPTSPWTGAALRTREAKQLDPSFLCDVELTYIYEDQNYSTPTAGVPPTRYSENASTISIPIEQHPSYVGMSDDDRAKIAEFFANPKKDLLTFSDERAQGLFNEKLKGINHYLVPSVTETITTFSSSQPSSVSGSVGTLSGSNKWLTISGSIQKEGAYWAKTIVKQYSAAGYEPALYP